MTVEPAVREEFEITLVGAPEDVAAVRALPCVRRAIMSDGAFERVVCAYFDDEERSLARSGISLRVRDDSDGRTLVAKSAGLRAPVLRREAERPFGLRDDMRRCGDPAIDAAVARAGRLRRIALTDVVRWSAPAVHMGAALDIAADIGAARAGARRTAISEVEIELTGGPAAPAFALARAIVAESSGRLRPAFGNKLQRIEPRRASRRLPADASEGAAIAHALERAAWSIDRAVAGLAARRPKAAARLDRALAGLASVLAFWPSAAADAGLCGLQDAARDARAAAAVANEISRIARRRRRHLNIGRATVAAAEETALHAHSASFSMFRVDLVEAFASWAGAGAQGGPARRVAAARLDALADSLCVAADDISQRNAFATLDDARRACAGLFARAAERRYAMAMKNVRRSLDAEKRAERECRLIGEAISGHGANVAHAAGVLAGVAATKARARAAEGPARLAALAREPRYWREDPAC